MRAAFFSVHAFERPFLGLAADGSGHELALFETALDRRTTSLASGFPAVSIFATDRVDAATAGDLARGGTKMLALRSAGFNHVDLEAAEQHGLVVARVPAYSPHSVAEHTVALILALDRKLHRAIARVRDHNFSLEGLLGFDLHGKTVGVVGTGRIGEVVARILTGFGCRILACDPVVSPECARMEVRYAPLEELLPLCDIVTLHCPLTPESRHLIDAAAIERMKPGVMLINTSRGAVVDTRALIQGLECGHIGSLGLDVYEEEGDLFFRDLSDQVIQDDVFARLLTFPNVVITAHQAFFTREAVENIERTTIANLTGFERAAIDPENLVRARERVR